MSFASCLPCVIRRGTRNERERGSAIRRTYSFSTYYRARFPPCSRLWPVTQSIQAFTTQYKTRHGRLSHAFPAPSPPFPVSPFPSRARAPSRPLNARDLSLPPTNPYRRRRAASRRGAPSFLCFDRSPPAQGARAIGREDRSTEKARERRESWIHVEAIRRDSPLSLCIPSIFDPRRLFRAFDANDSRRVASKSRRLSIYAVKCAARRSKGWCCV